MVSISEKRPITIKPRKAIDRKPDAAITIKTIGKSTIVNRIFVIPQVALTASQSSFPNTVINKAAKINVNNFITSTLCVLNDIKSKFTNLFYTGET